MSTFEVRGSQNVSDKTALPASGQRPGVAKPAQTFNKEPAPGKKPRASVLSSIAPMLGSSLL